MTLANTPITRMTAAGSASALVMPLRELAS